MPPFAAGGDLVEYPMVDCPLGAEMTGDRGEIADRRLIRPTAHGIGVTLTPKMGARYLFDPTAV